MNTSWLLITVIFFLPSLSLVSASSENYAESNSADIFTEDTDSTSDIDYGWVAGAYPSGINVIDCANEQFSGVGMSFCPKYGPVIVTASPFLNPDCSQSYVSSTIPGAEPLIINPLIGDRGSLYNSQSHVYRLQDSQIWLKHCLFPIYQNLNGNNINYNFIIYDDRTGELPHAGIFHPEDWAVNVVLDAAEYDQPSLFDLTFESFIPHDTILNESGYQNGSSTIHISNTNYYAGFGTYLGRWMRETTLYAYVYHDENLNQQMNQYAFFTAYFKSNDYQGYYDISPDLNNPAPQSSNPDAYNDIPKRAISDWNLNIRDKKFGKGDCDKIGTGNKTSMKQKTLLRGKSSLADGPMFYPYGSQTKDWRTHGAGVEFYLSVNFDKYNCASKSRSLQVVYSNSIESYNGQSFNSNRGSFVPPTTVYCNNYDVNNIYIPSKSCELKIKMGLGGGREQFIFQSVSRNYTKFDSSDEPIIPVGQVMLYSGASGYYKINFMAELELKEGWKIIDRETIDNTFYVVVI